MSEKQLKLKVMCSRLPGLRFEDPNKHEPRVKEPVYLGIQRGTEVIEQAPADRHRVVFHPEFRIGKQPDGSPNFLGPYAQGRPRDRFFYLSWGGEAVRSIQHVPAAKDPAQPPGVAGDRTGARDGRTDRREAEVDRRPRRPGMRYAGRLAD